MRGSVSVCLGLAVVAAVLHLSSTDRPPQQQSSSAWRSVEHRPWRRTKRQLSEIVRLYQTLVKENREDQMQARKKIQDILGRVFVSPEDATSTVAPALNSTSSEDNSRETPASTPRPLAKIDRTMLLANLRRNLRGIGRLFMRELRAALSQSRSNLGTYWSQLRRSVQQPISQSAKTRRQVVSPPHVLTQSYSSSSQPHVSTQYHPLTSSSKPHVPAQYQSHNSLSQPHVNPNQPHVSAQYQSHNSLSQPHVNPSQPHISTHFHTSLSQPHVAPQYHTSSSQSLANPYQPHVNYVRPARGAHEQPPIVRRQHVTYDRHY